MFSKTTSIRPRFFLIFAISVIFLLSASEIKAQDSDAQDPDKTEIIQLEQVNPKYICMINNTLFKKEQIPVPIDGITYYGCCQMCVKKLNENPESRFAIDPVSGNRVNKAEAVVGATPHSTVYYFESMANLKKFEPQDEEKRDPDSQ